MLVTRAASKVMRSQEAKPADPSVPEKGEVRGTIVTTGSSLSLHTAPGFLPYTTSKHAVLGLTKTAGMDGYFFFFFSLFSFLLLELFVCVLFSLFPV